MSYWESERLNCCSGHQIRTPDPSHYTAYRSILFVFYNLLLCGSCTTFAWAHPSLNYVYALTGRRQRCISLSSLAKNCGRLAGSRHAPKCFSRTRTEPTAIPDGKFQSSQPEHELLQQVLYYTRFICKQYSYAFYCHTYMCKSYERIGHQNEKTAVSREALLSAY